MSTVLDQIKESNYLVSEAEIEQLAAMHTDVSNTQSHADGSYLKILLAGCQAALGKGKRKLPNLAQLQTEALDKTHSRYYNAVLRGVITEDIAIVEGLDEAEAKRRHVETIRRATFARSAKSTLNAYIEAGGDIRSLDVASTSKGKLRKYVDEQQGTPSWMQSVESHRKRIENVCRKLAQTNPGEAREILESVLSHIQDVLDSITGGTQRHQEVAVVYAADIPTVVEIPEDFSEQTPGLEHIPEIHEFSEVATA